MRARVSVNAAFEAFAAFYEFLPYLEVVRVIFLESESISSASEFAEIGTHNFGQKLSQLEVVLITSAKGVHMYALPKIERGLQD